MEKIKKYFQRIGLEMPEEIVPDSKLLKELQFAHCTSVPYENLDILRGIPLSLEIDDLYESSKSGNYYAIDPQNITLIQELEEDYKRRQGNIVLRAVKDIKPEIYERKFRHKVNDNSLKRKLAISRYKVGKLIGGFLSSFGEESEYLSREYTNRLREIEDEMEAEREQRIEQENVKTLWNFEKG